MADNIPYWQMTPEQQISSWSQGLVPTQYADTISALTGASTDGTGAGKTPPPVDTGNMFSSAFGWLGNNAQGIGSLLQGIGALGSLYGTSKQLGLAQDQFNFQKQAYKTNLANQIASYNTNLEDKIRGRYSTVDQSEAQVQDYLNKNRLTK